MGSLGYSSYVHISTGRTRSIISQICEWHDHVFLVAARLCRNGLWRAARILGDLLKWAKEEEGGLNSTTQWDQVCKTKCSTWFSDLLLYLLLQHLNIYTEVILTYKNCAKSFLSRFQFCCVIFYLQFKCYRCYILWFCYLWCYYFIHSLNTVISLFPFIFSLFSLFYFSFFL